MQLSPTQIEQKSSPHVGGGGQSMGQVTADSPKIGSHRQLPQLEPALLPVLPLPAAPLASAPPSPLLPPPPAPPRPPPPTDVPSTDSCLPDAPLPPTPTP